MRDWQNDAPKMIAAIHADMPGCTPDELRTALRKKAWEFHCGTSWGKRVWSKHCRIYLAKLTGNGAYRGEKSVTWSLRSHDDRTDVSEVAKSMGGGGHRNAAGFREQLYSAD